jgi:hypothetical protein
MRDTNVVPRIASEIRAATNAGSLSCSSDVVEKALNHAFVVS